MKNAIRILLSVMTKSELRELIGRLIMEYKLEFQEDYFILRSGGLSSFNKYDSIDHAVRCEGSVLDLYFKNSAMFIHETNISIYTR
jgi:hypothetical protein